MKRESAREEIVSSIRNEVHASTEAAGNDRFRVEEKLPASMHWLRSPSPCRTWPCRRPLAHDGRARPWARPPRASRAVAAVSVSALLARSVRSWTAALAWGAEAGRAGVGGTRSRGRGAMSSRSATHPSDLEVARRLDSPPSIRARARHHHAHVHVEARRARSEAGARGGAGRRRETSRLPPQKLVRAA
jgi:hypothetical protein